MTHEEAIAARNNIAGRASLDGRAIASCNGSPGGCGYYPYDAIDALPEGERARLVAYESHAGMWRVCPKHQPTKRHAWVHDVPLTALMAQEFNNAWHVDSLRCYLPRNHPEYRA